MKSTRTSNAMAIALATLYYLSVAAFAEGESTILPFGLCLIPEMDYIPEVDGWPACSQREYRDELQRAAIAWEDSSRLVEKHMSINGIKNLSKWARSEMQKYVAIPMLTAAALEPMTVNKLQGKLVFGCTVQTLPTHNALVHRSLKLFILWDRNTHAIVRVTITIRGERLE